MYRLTAIKGLIERGLGAYGLTAALAALIFCSVMPARAQAQGTFTLTFKGQSTGGLVRGQTLRPTVSNVLIPPTPRGGSSGGDVDGDGEVDDIILPPIMGHVKVFDSSGLQIFQTDEVVIPAGGFHSFNINRSDIKLPGEPRTGRLQVRIEVVMVSPAAPGQDEKPSAGYFPYTLELIDNRSGATATWGDGSVRFISNGVSLPVARPF